MSHSVQVLVWGGGSGGVAAALQAARSGATTLLLTPGPWVGGMVSAAGVCAPDGNELTPWQTGIWGALLRELARCEPLGLDQNWVSCFGYRPATAEAILRRWLQAESRLQWWPCCRVLEVRRVGDRIASLRVERSGAAAAAPGSLEEIAASVVIDGSDRGDLLALAEAPFRFGWEPREQWQEPSAPERARLERDPFFQSQPIQSPTWVWLGQLDEEQLDGESLDDRAIAAPPVGEERLADQPEPEAGFGQGSPLQGSLDAIGPAGPPAERGEAGQTVGAAGETRGASGVEPPGSRLPLPRGPFEGSCAAFGVERTLTYGRLPGGLVMVNWPLHGNDWHRDLLRAFGGAMEVVPRSTAAWAAGAAAFPANPAEAELASEMRRHSEAFARELALASGSRLRAAPVFPDGASAARGELEGDQSLALMPYWREGRRLMGLEVVLEHHLLPLAAGACRAPLPLSASGRCSAIAVGNYANDHHYPGPDWPLAPKSCRWGGRWSGTPFVIPYGALVSSAVSNLLAADKAISVSHMANGATRLQPLVLNIGQAAGLAAALAVRAGLPAAAVPVADIQRGLIEDPIAPAGPMPLWDTPWHHPEWARRQLQALADPAAVTASARLLGSAGAGAATAAPAEPGEALWNGELRPDGQGGFALAVEGSGIPGSRPRLWPLITLEPALHAWLLEQDRPRPVALIGCANPWGPWLRVSRLASP